MLLDHPRQVLDRQRADDHRAADVRIGHDRGRVRVDQDRLHALAAQRQAGLHAGVVELGGLADEDRSRADDEDLARRRHAERALQRQVEDARRVDRPGRALRVELDRCDPPAGVHQALDRAVVEVAVADAVAGGGQGRAVDDLDLVVVGADVDAPGRRPRAPRGCRRGGRPPAAASRAPAASASSWWPRQMPRIGGAAAGRVAGERSHGGDLRRHARRVARAGREDDEVGRAAATASARRVGRQDDDLEAALGQRARAASASRRSRRAPPRPRRAPAGGTAYGSRVATAATWSTASQATLPRRRRPARRRVIDVGRARSPPAAPRRGAARGSAPGCRCPRWPGCPPRRAAPRATGPGRAAASTRRVTRPAPRAWTRVRLELGRGRSGSCRPSDG